MLALSPSAIGLTLLFLPNQERWMGAARTFAFGAALVVILATLLPGAFAALGMWAGVLAALAYLVPMGLDRLRHRSPGALPQLSFQLGFAALVLHQVFDGIQMGAVDHTLGRGVVLAIATHGAPLVAAAVLASARTEGRRLALARGLGLLVAVAVGVALGSALPREELATGAPFLRALIAGFLLHVVTHDLSDAPPESTTARAVDAFAFASGVGLPWWLLTLDPGDGHAHSVDGSALSVVGLLVVVAVITIASWTHGVRRSFGRLMQRTDIVPD